MVVSQVAYRRSLDREIIVSARVQPSTEKRCSAFDDKCSFPTFPAYFPAIIKNSLLDDTFLSHLHRLKIAMHDLLGMRSRQRGCKLT